MKKKLLVITTIFPRFKGDHLGVYLYRILKYLSEYLDNIIVFCPTDNKTIEGHLGKKQLKKDNINYEVLDEKIEVYRPLYKLPKSIYPFWSIMWLILNKRKINFNFVLSQFVFFSGLIGLITSKIYRKPFIVRVDGMDFWMPEKKGISRNVFFIPRYLVIKYSDIIIVEGRDTQRAICKLGIKKENIKCIPNGIDLRSFKSDAVDILIPGVNKEDVVITQIGNLIYLKGQRYLIESVSRIRREFKNLKLVFVGEGPEKKYYINLCKEKGINSIFLGLVHSEKIPMILKRTDIYVHLSLLEGMSNTILEAMSIGKPVIASRVGEIYDVIEDGINGFLVFPNDINNIVDRLRCLILDRNLANKIGMSAKYTIEERFDLEKIVKLYVHEMDNIALATI